MRPWIEVRGWGCQPGSLGLAGVSWEECQPDKKQEKEKYEEEVEVMRERGAGEEKKTRNRWQL